MKLGTIVIAERYYFFNLILGISDRFSHLKCNGLRNVFDSAFDDLPQPFDDRCSFF